MGEAINTLDLSITLWMQSFFGMQAMTAWNFVTNLGSGPFIIFFVGCACWLRSTRFGFKIMVPVILSGLVVDILKVTLAEPRPYYLDNDIREWRNSHGFGMPSGHAAGAMSLWTTIAHSLRSIPFSVFAIAAIVVIGTSRIYFGVHSTSQVCVGWFIGLATVLLCIRFGSTFTHRFKTLALSRQLTVAVLFTLCLVFYQSLHLAKQQGQFVIPNAWSASYQEASQFEDTREGKTLKHKYDELELYNAFGTQQIGLFFGAWLLANYLTRRRGFEDFTHREKIINVVLGVLLAIVLTITMKLTKDAGIVMFPLWASVPLLIALGVPATTRRFFSNR